MKEQKSPLNKGLFFMFKWRFYINVNNNPLYIGVVTITCVDNIRFHTLIIANIDKLVNIILK